MRNSFIPQPVRSVLSQTSEHALRAALYLGGQPADQLISAHRIAAALGTPPNYTAKTLRRLAQKGLLRSARGPSGGFQLRVDLHAVSLARLVDAVEERARLTSVCLLGDRPCDPEQPCEAHERWADLQDRMSRLMENTSVGDLMETTAAGKIESTTASASQEDQS